MTELKSYYELETYHKTQDVWKQVLQIKRDSAKVLQYILFTRAEKKAKQLRKAGSTVRIIYCIDGERMVLNER